MRRLGDFAAFKRSPLLWSLAVLAIVLMAFVPHSQLNDVFLHYVDEKVEFRLGYEFITENLTGLMPIEYSLELNKPGSVSAPKFLRKI